MILRFNRKGIMDPMLALAIITGFVAMAAGLGAWMYRAPAGEALPQERQEPYLDQQQPAGE